MRRSIKDHLPSNAKRVFHGVIFDVWQWPQKMFDGSVTTFERLSRPDTVCVIAIVGKRIILQKQEQPGTKPFTSLPCGRLDEQEAPLSAAKRELLEETGYTSQQWKLFKKNEPHSKIVWTIYTYIAHDCQKTAELSLDPGEKITNQLVTFETFLKLSDDPAFKEWDLKCDLVRARYDQKFRATFYKTLFG